MKLYNFEIAPNPRRVKLYLQYKGIEIDTETVDIRAREQFTDEFKAINSFCTVPTLVLDNGDTLIDAVSICLYLESLHPEKPLFGSTPLEQAQVLGWDHRIFTDGLSAVAEILRNQGDMFKGRSLPGQIGLEQIPALVPRGKKRLQGFFANVEQHMQGRDYLVGEQLSFADIDFLVVCDFAGWVAEKIPEECVNLQALYQRAGKAVGEIQ